MTAVLSHAHPWPSQRRKYTRPSGDDTSSATGKVSLNGRITPAKGARRDGATCSGKPSTTDTRNQDTGGGLATGCGANCGLWTGAGGTSTGAAICNGVDDKISIRDGGTVGAGTVGNDESNLPTVGSESPSGGGQDCD